MFKSNFHPGDRAHRAVTARSVAAGASSGVAGPPQPAGPGADHRARGAPPGPSGGRLTKSRAGGGPAEPQKVVPTLAAPNALRRCLTPSAGRAEEEEASSGKNPIGMCGPAAFPGAGSPLRVAHVSGGVGAEAPRAVFLCLPLSVLLEVEVCVCVCV